MSLSEAMGFVEEENEVLRIRGIKTMADEIEDVKLKIKDIEESLIRIVLSFGIIVIVLLIGIILK